MRAVLQGGPVPSFFFSILSSELFTGSVQELTQTSMSDGLKNVAREGPLNFIILSPYF